MKAMGTIAKNCHQNGSQKAATSSTTTISQNILRCMFRL